MTSKKINIPLSDIKFIQTSIERILHMQKINPHHPSSNQLDMDTLTNHSRNQYSPSKARHQSFDQNQSHPRSLDHLHPIIEERAVFANKDSKGTKHKKQKKEKSQDEKSKKTTKSKSKRKAKKDSIIQIKKEAEQSPLIVSQISPKKLKQTEQQNEDLFKNKKNVSTKSMLRRWTAFQQNKTQTQISVNQLPRRNMTQNFIRNTSYVNTKQLSQHKVETIKPTVKQQKKQKKKPYHLDKHNAIPLRTGQRYLQTKYAYKQLSGNEKREDVLKQKYFKLDMRLNKLRNQVHLQKISTELSKEERIKKQQKRKNTTKLQEYYRYSPLKKLLNYSTIERQKNHMKSYDTFSKQNHKNGSKERFFTSSIL